MKKNILKYLILVFILSTIFIGCTIDVDRITFKGDKPNKHYYTSKLIKDFSHSSEYAVNSVYMNFYKGKKLKEDEILIVRKFLKYLKKDNFIDKPENLPEKAVYRMYLTFDKSKYVINVYNIHYLSVHPWDGDFSMDYISMKNTSSSYNLFGLCKYLTSKSAD